MFEFIIASVFLGILFCAPPGALTAEAIRRGFARGFKAALLVELGSLIGDGTWAIIALVGAAFLVRQPVAQILLGVLGAGLLFYLAWIALRDARRGGMPESKGMDGRNDFVTGALISLGNPFTVAFWLGIGGTAVSNYIEHPEPIHFVIFFASFMTGALIWCFVLAGIVAWGKRYVTPRLFQVVNVVCGLFLAYFGGDLLWKTVVNLQG